jgi:hypothetical protein
VALTAPETNAKLPEVCAGVPLQVPFVNQSKVTLPVAVPLEPVTETESCTVDASATEVTAVSLALRTWVVTVGVVFVENVVVAVEVFGEFGSFGDDTLAVFDALPVVLGAVTLILMSPAVPTAKFPT